MGGKAKCEEVQRDTSVQSIVRALDPLPERVVEADSMAAFHGEMGIHFRRKVVVVRSWMFHRTGKIPVSNVYFLSRN